MVLAPAYSCAENIGVELIVVAELKFRDVERRIFGAHLVEGADNTAFEDRPEALNCVRVHSTDYVLLAVMIDRSMFVLAWCTHSSLASCRAGKTHSKIFRQPLGLASGSASVSTTISASGPGSSGAWTSGITGSDFGGAGCRFWCGGSAGTFVARGGSPSWGSCTAGSAAGLAGMTNT